MSITLIVVYRLRLVQYNVLYLTLSNLLPVSCENGKSGTQFYYYVLRLVTASQVPIMEL